MLPLFPIIAGIIGGGAVAMSNRKMSKGGSTYKDGGEIYTLVNKKTDAHYDTNDKRFYDASWERTLDSEEYLLQLKKNNPEKFEDFEIVRNSFQKGGSTYAGGGEVFNAHILTADNMLIHRRYPKKVTHQEIYQEYKDKGIEVKDSQIHHSKPIDFFDALRKETKRYVNENMNDDVEPSSIFISSTQQGNEYIANSIKGETVSGKPFELTPSDLFKMKKGGSTYAGGGEITAKSVLDRFSRVARFNNLELAKDYDISRKTTRQVKYSTHPKKSTGSDMYDKYSIILKLFFNKDGSIDNSKANRITFDYGKNIPESFHSSVVEDVKTEFPEFVKGNPTPVLGRDKEDWKKDDSLIYQEYFYDLDFSKGGSTYNDGGGVGEIDLFEDYEKIPPELQQVLDKYSLEDNDYPVLEQMLKEVESVGYTFDYGLDAEPYGLRKKGTALSDLIGFEEMDSDYFDKGGSTYAGGGEVYYLRKGDFAVVDEGNGQYGFVNVKEDANAFSKMKKFRDRVSATKIANKFKTKGHTVDVVAYTMTYARGGEVAEINKYKKQLIAKAKKKGLYENFGQAEVRKLEDKYGYTDNVREFDNWVMNFDLSDL